MKPSAWLLCGLLAVSLLALGCEANKPADEQQRSMVDMKYDTLAPSSESYEEYDGPDGASYESEGEIEVASSETVDGESDPQGDVYVVRQKDTLYSIARAYYDGDHTKWKLIYEANKERIGDPDKIHVGMKLIIPPARVQ